MKRGKIWIVLMVFTLISLVLVSCASSSTAATTIKTTPQTSSPSTSVTSNAPTTTLSVVPSPTSTAQTSGKWWDKLGQPQYGGEMVLRLNRDIVNWDPYNTQTLTSIESAWMEKLHADVWTVDPAEWSFLILYRPSQYVQGNLAENWEFSDPNTLVVHLRKGMRWQDIPPVNGREFNSSDVTYHFHRMYGGGDGFTKPSPFQAATVAWQSLTSVTALDKYTVAFKWNTSNPEFILDTMWGLSTANDIEAPEAVKLWGDLNDWHHAIGTGAFILTDFVSASSATLIKNPNYWATDERYPQNKLPYVDKLKVLIIPDDATAFAAMRTGKIDFIDQISYQQAQDVRKPNPEILQLTILTSQSLTLDPRNDVAPFKDLRVRKAMQMAIDLPTIAKGYYQGTASPYPSALTSNYMKGWGLPYIEWPQDLKDEYAYNPAAAKKLLADAGYPNGFKTDIVALSTGADMDLLQVVKSYFLAVGIDMEIRPMDQASWVAFVQTGHKHDQIAQRGVAGQLGNAYEPMRQLNKLQTNYSINWNMVADPIFDDFYTQALAATTVDQVKKILRDANEYVARQHFSISLLQPNTYAVYQPWFKGYAGQSSGISATTGAPQEISFYGARYWIDQKLKKSMGH